MASGGAALAGLTAGLALQVPTRQVVFVMACWMLISLAVVPRTFDAPIAATLRLQAWSVVLAAAVAGVTGLGRAALIQWWLVVTAAGVTLMIVSLTARRGQPPHRILIVGGNDQLQSVIDRWPDRAKDVLAGAVGVPTSRSGVAVIDDVVAQVRRTNADTVLCLSGGLDADEVRDLGWQLEDEPVRIAVGSAAGHAAPNRISAARLGGSTVALLRPSRPSRDARMVKAALDRAGAMALLLLLAPVLAVLLVAIRLDSAGSPIFRQVRVGHRGRLFTMYKFRTMVVDAESRKQALAEHDEGNGVLFKMRRDPRITRVGRLLRRTSLDELPQLLNVLCGDMSLIGPRPALPDEVATYDDRARRRLATRPGLTGLWQVSGRSDLDWEQSVALDLDYTDNISLRRDLAICLGTVRAVVTGRGAY